MDRTLSLRSSRNSEPPALGRSLSKIFSGRSDAPEEDEVGDLGLTTLYVPKSTAVADIVFVHGLGGGSRKTWTKAKDASTFWPLKWLPVDAEFQDVRIHTFGYRSDWTKGSVLDINDFAKSLLSRIIDAPSISEGEAVPLVLVCHSMGGLVAKCAYVLSQKSQHYERVRTWLRAIVFLATPHRGANLAETLANILHLSFGERPFLTDLAPSSKAIQAINDEFPRHSDKLDLRSFWEAQKTQALGTFVVPKENAILGPAYPNECTDYLDADHRNVVKFDTPRSVNYNVLRNALAASIKQLRTGLRLSSRASTNDQQLMIKEVLGVHDAPEDDYVRVESLKVRGSCEWIAEREKFRSWRGEGDPQVYWITAKPGAGKSVLCGHVVKLLREEGARSPFFFFSHTDKPKSSLSNFLRSVAWQMAAANETISDQLARICKRESHILEMDYKIIWRKLFMDCILKHTPGRSYYWLIDALDECRADKELVDYLMQAAAKGGIRILVTSRNTFAHYRIPHSRHVNMHIESIDERTTNADIELYLQEQQQQNESTKVSPQTVKTLLAKSGGCFLWTNLVLQELHQALTGAGIGKIIDEVPSDMDELYSRIVRSMYERAREEKLISAILEWTTCSTRALTALELNEALRLDLDDEIAGNVKQYIQQNCSQLITIADGSNRVRMIHLTASVFLFSDRIEEAYRLKRATAHRRIAMACLKSLNDPRLAGARARRPVRPSATEQSVFYPYAALSLFEHLAFVHSGDDEFVADLVRFLKSTNVLAWVEYIARHSSLSRLVQAGTALRNFVARRSDKMIKLAFGGPLSREIELMDKWATDLVRLVTKFGTHLKQSPSAVHLVAPFCPADSAIKTQFGISNRTINVTGVNLTTWDDCAATIMQHEAINTVTSVAGLMAFGSRSGQVFIYEENVYQKDRSLDHGESVKWALFGSAGTVLVAAGLHKISMWSTKTWKLQWRTEHGTRLSSLTFADDDTVLLATTRYNDVCEWDVSNGMQQDPRSFEEDLDESARMFRRSAITVISADKGLLAIACRGEDISLWDLVTSCTRDVLSRDEGTRGPNARRKKGVTPVRAMVFSSTPGEPRLLAACYTDGIMALFDLEQVEPERSVTTIRANGHTLASSTDGLTLACGTSDGAIQLFDSDDLRLFCLQDKCCSIWDPPVLVRQHVDEGSDTVSISTGAQDARLTDPINIVSITSIGAAEVGKYVLCGNKDGSVCLRQTGQVANSTVLLWHAKNVEILFVEWDFKSLIVVTVDVSSRVMAHQLKASRNGGYDCGRRLLDVRVGSAVVQIVLSQGANELLVSTEDEDVLLTLNLNAVPGTEPGYTTTVRRSFPSRLYHRWCPHPRFADQLILFAAGCARIFQWTALEEITVSEYLRLQGVDNEMLAITSAIPCFGDEYLALTFSETGSNPRSDVLFYSCADLVPENALVEPDTAFESLVSRVHVLLGTVASHRLVFLDQEGWICSALGASSFHPDHYDRHHFLPVDWLTGMTRLRMEVCARDGALLFARRDELICIRRGLEHFEHGQSRAFSKRPSLKGGTLSDGSVSGTQDTESSSGSRRASDATMMSQNRRSSETTATSREGFCERLVRTRSEPD